MLYEVVMFGGIVFWVLFFIISAIIIIGLEAEAHPGKLAAVPIFFLAATFMFTGLWDQISVRPWTTLAMVFGGYVAGCCIWGIPKWFFVLLDLRRQVAAVKAEFLHDNGITDGKIPPTTATCTLPEEFHGRISHNYTFSKYGISYDIRKMCIVPPLFSKNRDRVLTWMCYWPWNAFWTLIKNPVRWICETILDLLQSMFQKMSNAIFSGFDDSVDEVSTGSDDSVEVDTLI